MKTFRFVNTSIFARSLAYYDQGPNGEDMSSIVCGEYCSNWYDRESNPLNQMRTCVGFRYHKGEIVNNLLDAFEKFVVYLTLRERFLDR